MKLEQKVPIARAKLQRHSDDPTGGLVRKKPHGVRAVEPISGKHFRVRGAKVEFVMNLKQGGPVRFVVFVRLKNPIEPENYYPYDPQHQCDDGGDDM